MLKLSLGVTASAVAAIIAAPAIAIAMSNGAPIEAAPSQPVTSAEPVALVTQAVQEATTTANDTAQQIATAQAEAAAAAEAEAAAAEAQAQLQAQAAAVNATPGRCSWFVDNNNDGICDYYDHTNGTHGHGYNHYYDYAPSNPDTSTPAPQPDTSAPYYGHNGRHGGGHGYGYGHE